MGYQAIKWARQSTAGDQELSSGERLVNFYAVKGSPKGEDSKVPVILYGTPGFHPWVAFQRSWLNHAETKANTKGRKDWNGIWLVNSPTHGKHLQGIFAGKYFVDYEYDQRSFSTPQFYHGITKGGESLRVRTLISAEISPFTENVNKEAVPEYAVRHAVGVNNVVFITANKGIYRYHLVDDKPKSIMAPTPSDKSAHLPDEEWVDCAWVDGYYFLLTQGGELYHSLYNEIVFDQLDFARIAVKPDNAVGLSVYMRRLYVFSEQSIEQWYNAGDADFAFRRNNSFSHEVGCLSKYTIQSMPQGILFLGNERIVYLLTSGAISRISTESVEYDIGQSQAELSRAYSYTEEGHRIYCLVLYKEGVAWKNWSFDNTTFLWHERTELNILSAVALPDVKGNIVCRTTGNKDEKDDWVLFMQSLNYGYDMVQEGDTYRDTEISRLAQSPILHANQQRVSMRSCQVDVQKSSTGLTIDRLCGVNHIVYFNRYVYSFLGEVKPGQILVSQYIGKATSASVWSNALTSLGIISGAFETEGMAEVGLKNKQRGRAAFYPDVEGLPSLVYLFDYQATITDSSNGPVFTLMIIGSVIQGGNYPNRVLFHLGKDGVRYDTKVSAVTSFGQGGEAAVAGNVLNVRAGLVFLDPSPDKAELAYHRHCATLSIRDHALNEEIEIGHKSLEEVRLKWNQLGQFREGRNIKLGIVSKDRIRILGAYVETDIQDA